MRYFVINLYLLIGAYHDGKTKKIKSEYLWIGGFLGMICKIADFITKDFYLYEWILCFIPGIFFLICAKVGSEKIGNGDGWILIILGSCFPGVQVWSLFYLSVLLLAFCSLFLLLLKKANRKTEIPYIPFLWLSHVILWGLQYVL